MSNGPKAKHDPLEAAKITAETMKVDDTKAQQSKWPAAPPATPTAAKPEVAQPPPAAPVAPAAKVEAPVVAAPAKPVSSGLYKVKARKVISFNGSITTLVEGATVDERGYGGPVGIAKLRAAGVELEEIK